MLRNLLAVILGLIMCNVVFGGLAFGTMFVWPDYATHGNRWLDQRIFTFTSIMACMNLIFWALAFIGAGWATAQIARDIRTVWVVAGLMQMYAVYVHLFREWSTFPWWYNVVVAVSVVPATWLGTLFVRPSRAKPTPGLSGQ
jgi:hypothetical protein